MTDDPFQQDNEDEEEEGFGNEEPGDEDLEGEGAEESDGPDDKYDPPFTEEEEGESY